VQPVQCHNDCNGSISVSSNAINPFYLTWSTGDSTFTADSLCGGSYWVKISDAWGCTDSVSYDLINPDPLLILLQDSITLNCFGNCDTLNAVITGGSGGNSYLWSDGTSGSQVLACDTIPLTLTVTDMNGCNAISNVTILHPIEPVYSFSSENPSCVNCPDGAVTIHTQNGAAPFIVLFDSVEYSIANAGDSIQITNLLQGWYEIQMTGSNGCTVTDSVYLDGTILSTAASEQQDRMLIIPNPTTGDFSLYFKSNVAYEYKIEILDYSGKIIFENKLIQADRVDLNGSSWSKGIYTVRVFSDENYFVRKLIVN